MNIFSRTPGVEWNPQDLDDTQPVATTPANSDSDLMTAYPTNCPACQGELGIDSYCLSCGQKAKSLREHFQITPSDWVAGVCDIGLVHVRNEDAMAGIADGFRAVLVACDGVTTSDDSDVASLAAARTACHFLWSQDPQGTGTLASRTEAVGELLTQAVAEANQEVINQTSPTSLNAAASTIAIAIVDSEAVFCASLGDSRVYWIPDDGEPQLLTKDHSLAQDGIDSGAKREDAEASALAHTITKWLGRDATDIEPYLAWMPVTDPGWILVCTDGLWNYASEPTAIKELVGFLDEPTPLALAQYLVAWANEKGGHDNITVVCARVDAGSPTVTALSEATGVVDSETPTISQVLDEEILEEKPTTRTRPIASSNPPDTDDSTPDDEPTDQGQTPSDTQIDDTGEQIPPVKPADD
ncbi:MAG: serine/threonine-protein phosphatase [Propionibacteriaceae bacterium]|nr:serine/threonine-protein phosphatase [Propionibacteriaceae bacterium]